MGGGQQVLRLRKEPRRVLVMKTRTPEAIWERDHFPMIGKLGQAALAAFAIALVSGGCTAAQVQEGRDSPSTAAPPNAVAILTSRKSPMEEKAVGCISEGVHTALPKVRVIPPEEFRRSVFTAWPPDEPPLRGPGRPPPGQGSQG